MDEPECKRRKLKLKREKSGVYESNFTVAETEVQTVFKETEKLTENQESLHPESCSIRPR